MSEHEPIRIAGADDLVDRLDQLGRSLVTAEEGRARPPEAFLEAVERRWRFGSARRAAPLAALAAAAAIALLAGWLVTREDRPGPSVPVATNGGEGFESAEAPTLGNLRAMNRDIISPDKLKLSASNSLGDGPRGAGTDITERPLIPADARAADRIDGILSGK